MFPNIDLTSDEALDANDKGVKMTKYSLSYSSIEDIYAIAAEESGKTKTALLKLAEDLEQVGTGSYDGEDYIYRNSAYGMEVVSMEDFNSENED